MKTLRRLHANAEVFFMDGPQFDGFRNISCQKRQVFKDLFVSLRRIYNLNKYEL